MEPPLVFENPNTFPIMISVPGTGNASIIVQPGQKIVGNKLARATTGRGIRLIKSPSIKDFAQALDPFGEARAYLAALDGKREQPEPTQPQSQEASSSDPEAEDSQLQEAVNEARSMVEAMEPHHLIGLTKEKLLHMATLLDIHSPSDTPLNDLTKAEIVALLRRAVLGKDVATT